MSLVVNTNVSSLTAQRALAYADSLQGEAMTRLSTGSKINSASDDAAGLAIAQRMTAQVNGLNMAIKNANDGISLTQSVEGALVEVSDMLQRLRELSVQAANDTNTGIDRKAIQEEVDLLVAEISRVSSNTRFNNQKVLDGTFTNKKIQVGTQGAEVISLSLDSSAADALGAFKVSGDIVQASAGYGSGIFVNGVDADDDIIINGNSLSKTIDVTARDSSEKVAEKINAVSGETGVSAEAKTHAYLYSMSSADETISLKINNHTTGDFTMSSSTVLDAVEKINTISGKTGVSASVSSDNRIVLYSNAGKDILIENEKASTKLRVKTAGFDGITEVTKQAAHALKTNSAAIDVSTAHRITNSTTGTVTNFTTGGSETAKTLQNKINSALGATEGVRAQRVSTAAFTAIAEGDYYLEHKPTGDVFKLSLGAATVAAWNTAIQQATYTGGSHDGQTRNMSAVLVASANGTNLQITGDRVFGDFEIYSDAALSVNVMDKTHAQNRTGVEATGIEVEAQNGTAAVNVVNGGSRFGTPNDKNLMTGLATTAGANFTVSGGVGTFTSEQNLRFVTDAAETDKGVTITGTDRDGNVISETITFAAAGNYDTTFRYVTITAMTTGGGQMASNLTVSGLAVSTTFEFRGAREFGDFDMADASDSYAASILTSSATGDHDTQDYAFGASGGTDSATIQGTLELSSSKTFSVTQSGVEEPYSGGPANDNYFTTGAATLSTVSNVDLRSQAGASAALSIIDGAIEKISSMRVSLGAVENRLDHTVSNLMNISENTESARSRIQDADFASESAKLAKAQVLKQAGVGMLAQANASGQLVLQLLQ